MKQRITGVVLSLFAGLAPLAAHAAAPGLNITTSGQPARWDNTRSITYNIDQGPLGKMSNSRAARMVLAAFEEWQKIETAQLTFEESDPLDRDVEASNFSDFLGGLPSDVNPVIFDNDGAITQGTLGTVAGRATLAFGGILQSTPTGKIAQGYVVINGRAVDGLFDPDDPAEPELTRAVVRAIGQMLGLGSSDLNDELIFDGNVANNSAVPVMYPSSITGGGFTPTLDDRIAISTLYPSTSFEANTGLVRGQVTLADGTTGYQNIAVILRSVDDPVNQAVQVISGASFLNTTRRGSRDPALRGAFEIRVPPGNYTIEYRQLRQPIGPQQAIVVLPGGTQYYAAEPSPTAGPDPSSATPVTVTAGQTTELKLVAGGTAAPAAVAVTETEPNDAPIDAPLLPLAATVTGNVSADDPALVTVDAGGGSRDRIEDFYRIVVPETSVLVAHLQPKELVDLDLYLFASLPGGASLNGTGSLTDGTDPEAIQIQVAPGTYYLGVTAWDGVQNPAPTEYTLSLVLSPVGARQIRPRPVLNQLVVGDITADSAEARWVTDQDATADVIVAMPKQQFGDPTAARTHRVPLTGLTAAAYNSLVAVSQLPGASRDRIPGVYFRTADTTAVEGAAKLNAAMIGQIADFIDIEGVETETRLVALGVRNTGGSATGVQITALNVTPGWRLATPVAEPISVGRIDSGGTAIVVVRLLREAPTTGDAPAVAVTGTGTLAGADGAAADFNIGP